VRHTKRLDVIYESDGRLLQLDTARRSAASKCPILWNYELNPLHPRADGDAVAAGFKKRFPFSKFSALPAK
jgi:hypothetical protein